MNSSESKTFVEYVKKFISDNENKYDNVLCIKVGCYGQTKSILDGERVKLAGQEFWKLITGDENFYITFLETIRKINYDNPTITAAAVEKRKLIKETAMWLNDDFSSNGILDYKKISQHISSKKKDNKTTRKVDEILSPMLTYWSK